MDRNTLKHTYQETVYPLYEYVSRRCGGDRGLAEDVVQEAWLRAVVDWRKRGFPDEPLAWLRTVARNLLFNYYRRARPVSIENIPPGWEPGVIDNGFEFDSPDIAALVNWGLARLKPLQSQLLEAYHFEGLRVAEIAARNGLSERAVEGRLRRARLKLRQHIESVVDGDGDAS